jgi:hypothetical protein
MLQSLADHSICHGDLKATNFIAAQGRLWVVDLDALQRFRMRWRFRRAFKKDLERLTQNWSDAPATEAIFRRCMQTLRF